MKTWRRRLSRPEAVLVAAALLLPIPLFAQSGLSVPLPGVVERGLGSLVTVDATDERSGTSATGRASENGKGDRRSARTSLRIGRSAGLSPVLRGETQTGSGSGGSPESGTPAGDDRESGTAPAEGEPEGDGGGGAGSPGDPSTPDDAPAAGSESGSGSGTRSGSGNQTSVSGTGQGQGAKAGVSAGTGGLAVDVGADNGATGSEAPGSVGVDVTAEDGSQTSAGTALPSVGVLSP